MSAIPAVFPAAPPSCVSRRPKRAAASKAEDVFKSLMVTGDREGRASSAEEPESDTSKTGRNVGKGTSDGDPVGWLRQQSQGKRGVGGVVFEVDVLVAGRDSKGEHDSGFEGVSNATGNRKKVATTMGRAKRSRGAIGKHEQWKADRPVKSSTHRRDKQKNIERPKAQGGAAASVGSVSRLLESFAEFTVSGKVVGEAPDASCALKISASKSKKLTKNHQQQQQQPQRQDVMPPKTSMALVWSALDTVLADLPPTEILTIDSLVGNGEARRRAAAGAAGGRDCPHVSTHSGASSRRTVSGRIRPSCALPGRVFKAIWLILLLVGSPVAVIAVDYLETDAVVDFDLAVEACLRLMLSTRLVSFGQLSLLELPSVLQRV